MSEIKNIVKLTVAINSGERDYLDKLMPEVEIELKRIALHLMKRENPNHIFQPEDLVNETYLQFAKQRNVDWQNRSHFFAVATKIMRRILLKHARDQNCQKRGGKSVHFNLENLSVSLPQKSEELTALEEALKQFAKIDRLKYKIVKMRYFGGLTIEETAQVSGIAPITVSVHLRFAKTWLASKIRK